MLVLIPLDILMAVYMILRQVNNGEAKIDNEYNRAVREEGNLLAQKVIGQVFDITSREWRGFPKIPNSVMEIKMSFQNIMLGKI